nr:hypothetical protein [Tanacetum cinerariifolium]
MKVTPPDAYSDGTLFGGHGHLHYLDFIRFVKGECEDTSWTSYLVWHYLYHNPRYHTYCGPPTTHVDTTLTPTKIPIVSPIVPSSPDYTLASPNYSHASDTEFDQWGLKVNQTAELVHWLNPLGELTSLKSPSESDELTTDLDHSKRRKRNCQRYNIYWEAAFSKSQDFCPKSKPQNRLPGSFLRSRWKL